MYTTTSAATKIPHIMMVEDNQADIEMMREIIKENQFQLNLNCYNNGLEALDYLRMIKGKKHDGRPNIILLDLNMPQMDGREFLSILKNDPDLKSIPVIILTTSESQEDIKTCYNLHANCFFTKPFDYYSFCNIVKLIEDFWLKQVKLPMV